MSTPAHAAREPKSRAPRVNVPGLTSRRIARVSDVIHELKSYGVTFMFNIPGSDEAKRTRSTSRARDWDALPPWRTGSSCQAGSPTISPRSLTAAVSLTSQEPVRQARAEGVAVVKLLEQLSTPQRPEFQVATTSALWMLSVKKQRPFPTSTHASRSVGANSPDNPALDDINHYIEILF